MLKIQKRNILWAIFVAVALCICTAFFVFRDPYVSLKRDVWNQLNDTYKSTVSSDWKSAKVQPDKAHGEIIVEFEAGKSSVLGNIRVHVDPQTHKILSVDGRA